MLVPLSWLRDFAPFDADAKALGVVFDELGMVVESIAYVGAGLEDVVVARVLSIEAIPGADKIRKIVVDAGGPGSEQIVCGAWNFAEGDAVPLARVGAVLPNGMEIGRRKMRGVVSDGMLCSARELGLGDDAAGLLVLTDGSTPGTPITEALNIEPDVVFDLAIEANRPDANCIAGVARDAAARLGLPFGLAGPPAPEPAGTPGFAVAVTVTAADLCDRFSVTVFEEVHVAPSPDLIARRLTLAGMRPISNVVDASNYVMLELGQPTHAYDLDRLPGQALGVRAAHAGERLTTLDGVERVLGGGARPDALIVDGDDRAIGIAGIMGGESSEVHDRTERIALEAAHFVPMAIARTSKRLGLRSEASARFERGTDLEGIERSVARFAEVLALTSPGLRSSSGVVDWQAPGAGERAPISLRIERLNGVLGTALGAEDVVRLLTPIGFDVTEGSGSVVEVTPPSFRPDAVAEIDLIEEVARHHGYASIPRTTVRPAQVGALTAYQRARRKVRSVLTGASLSEAVGSPLVAPGDHPRAGLEESAIAASDPLVREESMLRSSLRPGLLRAVAYNRDRRVGDVGLFEIGHVWEPSPRGPSGSASSVGSSAQLAGSSGPAAQPAGSSAQPAGSSGPAAQPGEGLPYEREVLAAGLAGAGPDGRGGDAPAAVRLLRRVAADLRVDVSLVARETAGMHPTRTAAVVVAGEAIGWVGEIDPAVCAAWSIDSRVGWLEVDFTRLVAARRSDDRSRPISRFPSSDLDLAFVVPDVEPAAGVGATLEGAAGGLLERVELFDVYRGVGVPEGHRSLAFRIRLVAQDRTLTDAETAGVRAACITAVESGHGAVLRA